MIQKNFCALCAQFYLQPPCSKTSSYATVVIMDNASIHHVDGIVNMIEEVGAMVMFLPPYSPDFNPIEALFSKLKNQVV